MKKYILIALLSLFVFDASAQMFVWKDGVVQYAFRNTCPDSITFYEPADYGELHPVDLGLPSGIKWADKNLGATAPSEPGTPFAWGEVATKATFTGDNYVGPTNTSLIYDYSDGSSDLYEDEDHFYNLEFRYRLLPQEDAAHMLLGGAWRMPTLEEMQELYNEGTIRSGIVDGVEGVRLQFVNGNHQFFPLIPQHDGNVYIWTASWAEERRGPGALNIPDVGGLGAGLDAFYIVRWGVSGIVGGYIRPVYDESMLEEANIPNPLVFSIGKNHYVYFSPGNLQYQASTNAFRFAPNQFDVIGEPNINTSPTYTGWIDLFEWGYGNNPTHVFRGDWDDYDEYVDYGSNAITNGNAIDAANTWRTLSGAEWEYIMYHRYNADHLKGSATVNGMFGFLLLPDGWQLPAGCSFTPTIDDGTTNQYSISEWQAMETAGAIFLPAAGRRFSSDIGKVGTSGLYWTSSYFEDYNSDLLQPLLYIKQGAAYLSAYDNTRGLSIRLVKDYQ